MSLTDYRNRASVLVWVILLGLAAQRFLQLQDRVFSTMLFGSPITLTLTDNTILGLLLAGLVASGTEAIVRAHPRSQHHRGGHSTSVLRRSWSQDIEAHARVGESQILIREHWVFWALPVALIGVAILLLPLAPSVVYWVLGLIATGLALGISMAGIYHTIDPFQNGYRRARLGLNVLTYAVALLLFLVVYRTRTRSIVSATEVMAVSGLLALELLRGSERPTILVALYAGITGMVLGQATWALNYWRLDSLTGGLVLLIVFYNLVGLSQNAIQGRLRRRIVVEYGLITLAALALIWEFAP